MVFFKSWKKQVHPKNHPTYPPHRTTSLRISMSEHGTPIHVFSPMGGGISGNPVDPLWWWNFLPNCGSIHSFEFCWTETDSLDASNSNENQILHNPSHGGELRVVWTRYGLRGWKSLRYITPKTEIVGLRMLKCQPKFVLQVRVFQKKISPRIKERIDFWARYPQVARVKGVWNLRLATC